MESANLKRGHVRSDGMVFESYGKLRKKTGLRSERWVSADEFERIKAAQRSRKIQAYHSDLEASRRKQREKDSRNAQSRRERQKQRLRIQRSENPEIAREKQRKAKAIENKRNRDRSEAVNFFRALATAGEIAKYAASQQQPKKEK